MKQITVKLPKWMIELIDSIVSQGLYSNRTEFIRESIRKLLLNYFNSGMIKDPRARSYLKFLKEQ